VCVCFYNVEYCKNLHIPNIWNRHGSAFWQCAVLVLLFNGLWQTVLWLWWLDGRKGIRPVKTEWWGTSIIICLEWGVNDLHMVQLMPLPPIISCFIKIWNGLLFWWWLTQVVLEKRLLNACSSDRLPTYVLSLTWTVSVQDIDCLNVTFCNEVMLLTVRNCC